MSALVAVRKVGDGWLTRCRACRADVDVVPTWTDAVRLAWEEVGLHAAEDAFWTTA